MTELPDNADLTDTQLLTYALHHEHGLGIREIARRRGVAPATVRECLQACERAIERAKESTSPPS
jgi:predicted transcriptional regulator